MDDAYNGGGKGGGATSASSSSFFNTSWDAAYGITTDQLLRYFSTTATWPGGFQDNHKTGFFTVFEQLGRRLDDEERMAYENNDVNENDQFDLDTRPCWFGSSGTLYEDGPRDWYTRFLNFKSVKSFRWVSFYLCIF